MKTMILSDGSILDPQKASLCGERFISGFDSESNVRQRLYRREDGRYFLFCTREVFRGKTIGPTFTHDYFTLLEQDQAEVWLEDARRQKELLERQRQWTRLRFSEEGRRLAKLGLMEPYPVNL